MANNVSIIIPVLKEKEELYHNINSIITQKSIDIELIIISNNENLSIIRNKYHENNKIRYYNTTTTKIEDMWNLGLKKSTTDYIIFLDQTTRFITCTSVKNIYNKINEKNLDILEYNTPIQPHTINTSETAIFPMNKIYSKNYLIKNNFTFHSELKYNHHVFYYDTLINSDKIGTYNRDILITHYENSLNHFTEDNIADYMILVEIINNLFYESDKYMEYKKDYYNLLIKSILHRYDSLPSTSKRHYFKIFQDLLSNIIPEKEVHLLHDELFLCFQAMMISNHENEFEKLRKNNINRNPSISVIIPFHNTELYIKECIDSVLNQSYADIEVICVNDNSTDNSLEIIKEYKQKDDRIVIINNEINYGAGYSRNRALRFARGKYINFIDSDDWIDSSTYELTYKKVEEKNLDFIMYRLINYNHDTGETFEDYYYNLGCLHDNYTNKVFNKNDLHKVDGMFKLAVSPCNKLFKREFIQSNNIYFPEKITFEDNIFFFKVMLMAERISFTPEHLYYRRRRENSVMRTQEHFSNIITISTEAIKLFKKLGFYDEYKQSLLNFKVNVSKNFYNKLDYPYKKYYYKSMHEDFINLKTDKELYSDLENYLTQDNLKFIEYVIKYEKDTLFDINYEKSMKTRHDTNSSTINYDFSTINEIEKINNNKNEYKNKDEIRPPNEDLIILCKNNAETINKLSSRIFTLTDDNNKLIYENKELNEKLDLMKEENILLKEQLLLVFSSNSWNITRPLRIFMRRVRKYIQ
ncbi:glycosyltransferase [Methanosphaera sp.]